MNLYSVVLEVPEELDITAQDGDGNYVIGNDVAYQIGQLFAVWPAGISPGTKSVAGKKIINAVIRSKTTQPFGLIQSLIDVFELDWVIMGLKSFDAPEPVYDGEEVVKWQAKLYVPLSDDVIPYIDKIPEEQQPIYDDELTTVYVKDEKGKDTAETLEEYYAIIGYKPITQFPFTEYSGGSKW